MSKTSPANDAMTAAADVQEPKAKPTDEFRDENNDGADDATKPYGDPNDPGSKVHFPATAEAVSPEDKYYGEQNAMNAGKGFRIQVDNAGASKTFSYDSKEEQQEAAEWFSALFPTLTIQRSSLEGGALVVISTAPVS